MHNDINFNDIVSFNEEAKEAYRYTTKESGCIGQVTRISADKKTFSVKVLEISDEYKGIIGEEVHGISYRYIVFENSYEEYKKLKKSKKENNCNLNNLLLNSF